MECKFCSAAMEDGQEVCPVCGKKVEEEIVEETCACQAEETCSCEETECACEEGECTCEETECTCEGTQPKKKAGLVAWLLVIALAAVLAFGANYVYKNVLAAQEEQTVTFTGGTSYSVEPEELTDEVRSAVVATVEKNNVLRGIKNLLGIGQPKEGLTNAMLSVYYWDGFYSFYNNYGYYAMMMGLDPLTMDTTEYADGQTWQESFLSQAMNQYYSAEAVCRLAEKEGYALSPEMQEEYDAAYEQLSAMEDIEEQIAISYGPGVSFDEYMDYLYKQFVYASYMQDKQDAITYTDEDLSAYYDANAEGYLAQGVEKTDPAEVVSSQAQAEKVYADWQAGDATESTFAALAITYTQDPGSQENGGLYENVTEGQMVPAFNDWCFDEARQSGDTGIVETDYGHHIMYFVAKNSDGTINVRHILFSAVDPDAWKETVAADYVSAKMNEFTAALQQSYALRYDAEKIALALPEQMTAEQ